MMRKLTLKSRTVRSAFRMTRSLFLTMCSLYPTKMNQPVSLRARRGKTAKARINSGSAMEDTSPTQPKTMSSVFPLTPSSTLRQVPTIMKIPPSTVKASILPKYRMSTTAEDAAPLIPFVVI